MIICLLLLLLPATCLADFSIKFQNTSAVKMYYLFYWVDHPFGLSRPANMAGGELDASESIEVGVHYKPGKYYVIWIDQNKLEHQIPIQLNDTIRAITVTPEEVILSLSI
jgi:hypothetical protein